MIMEREKNIRNFIQVIPETGISVDYLNELGALWLFSMKLQGTNEEKWTKFWSSSEGEYFRTRGRRLVSRYEECYPPDTYDYSQISEKTKENIKRLNVIAGKASDLFAGGKFTRQEFSQLFVEANELVYGEKGGQYIEERDLYENEFGKMKD